MNEYCKDHIDMATSIAKIEKNSDWLVCELKKINGALVKHIEDGDKVYRPQVQKNTAFRYIMMWFIGAGSGAVFVYLIITILFKR